MTIEARLGRTRYVIEDQPGGEIVCVTRHNSDGEKHLHFPVELLRRYVQDRGTKALMDLIFKDIPKTETPEEQPEPRKRVTALSVLPKSWPVCRFCKKPECTCQKNQSKMTDNNKKLTTGDISNLCRFCESPACKSVDPHFVDCFDCPAPAGMWKADIGGFLCETCYARRLVEMGK